MSHAIFLKRAGRRRGVVAVLVAVLLIPILGIFALALDGGLLLDNRRIVQGASDASALAAATELFINYPELEDSNFTHPDPYGASANAALATAAHNGFPNDGVRSSVTVHIPPQSGPFANRAGYAEVIVTFFQKRYLSGIWGTGSTPVSARAVARGRWAGSKLGIIVLDPALKNALYASGTGSVLVTGGASVIVNSNHTEAAAGMGGGSITAPTFEIAGGYTGALIGEVNTGVPPTPDPLRYLPQPPEPPNGTISIQSLGSGKKQYTLTPGRYSKLPNFTSGDTVILQQASANSVGGVYYIDGGGFTSTGANIVMDPNTSGGVMIFNNCKGTAVSENIAISGNSAGTVNLSALTDGPYAGILFWQNRTSGQQMSVSGGGNFSLSGTFYTANALLKVTGNGDAVIGSQYISRSLSLGGGGATRIDYSDQGTARLREVILVE